MEPSRCVWMQGCLGWIRQTYCLWMMERGSISFSFFLWGAMVMANCSHGPVHAVATAPIYADVPPTRLQRYSHQSESLSWLPQGDPSSSPPGASTVLPDATTPLRCLLAHAQQMEAACASH